jgi:hypothetical protein
MLERLEEEEDVGGPVEVELACDGGALDCFEDVPDGVAFPVSVVHPATATTERASSAIERLALNARPCRRRVNRRWHRIG